MKDITKKVTLGYASALRQYMAREEEAILQRAYELGRKAIGAGLGVLDMARVHQQALSSSLPPAVSRESIARTLRLAETFFFEALSPFEAAHRGFRDANARLQQLIKTLEVRNREMAEINCELETEVAERKRTETALRESEQNLRSLSNKVLHVQEEERTHISRELHDEVGQALTAVNVSLAMVNRNGATSAKDVSRRITEAQKLLAQTMETVHRFARELRPSVLDYLGLLPALRSYARAFSARTGIRIRFQASPTVEKLDDAQKTVMFRVAQESLTNVAKHAHASEVALGITTSADGIRMTVKDNGRAFGVSPRKAGKAKKRLGLLGMQERVRLVNGQFDIDSKPGDGTTVRISIPWKRN